MQATFQNTSLDLHQPYASVDLDAVSATQVVRTFTPTDSQAGPHLLVDCGRLKCLRTLGVSHVISELLVLHQAGANVWLRNVTPVLGHCLTLLRLNTLFHTAPTPA